MTSIEWTEKTWNTIVGCSIVSPGCTHCYAMGLAARLLDGNPKTPHYFCTTKRVKGKAVWTGKVARAPDAVLLEPLRAKKPTLYFVNSMGDLFHESVPDEWIDRVFAVMALCPHHTFQVLTKRSKRMREYMDKACGRIADTIMAMRRARGEKVIVAPLDHVPLGHEWWPLPNVWLGVSAEDQTRADERIPDLLATPAAVRWVSAEPLIGPIDFNRLTRAADDADRKLPGFANIERFQESALYGQKGIVYGGGMEAWASENETILNWIIVGGESGPNARPMHPDWARAIRDQCGAAGTAFFFKQWGSWTPCGEYAPRGKLHFTYLTTDGRRLGAGAGRSVGAQKMICTGKKAAGRLLDGVEHNAMPARP